MNQYLYEFNCITYQEWENVHAILKKENPIIHPFPNEVKDVYNPASYLDQKFHYNTTTYAIVDRQIMSYLTALVRGSKIDQSCRNLACSLMILFIISKIEVDPSVSIREYADTNNNERAQRELQLISYCNNVDIRVYLDVISGKDGILNINVPRVDANNGLSQADFSKHSRIFDFNYIMIMKSIVINRNNDKPIEKIKNMMSWMHDSFYWGACSLCFINIFLVRSVSRK